MRGVPQKRKKQMGLEKRMNRLLFSTMIPMACLLVILLLIFWQYAGQYNNCLLYTSPSPRDRTRSRMPSSA